MANIREEELLALLKGQVPLWPWLEEARRLKELYFGKHIETCAIVNAKSGQCPSDCKFCAQSRFWPTKVETYPLLSEAELLAKVAWAKEQGIDRFSFVTSGVRLSPREFDRLLATIQQATRAFPEVKICASLGQLGREELEALKEAGLARYHHNLETAASFYPQIVSVQQWEDRLRTAELVKEVGLSLCCGGIWGLGESDEQILEFIYTLKALSPDSVPVNFLHPIAQTPLERASFLTPQKALAILVVLRFLLPDKAIRVCGGREYNLRDLQAWALLPANALMVGHYLTTKGRALADDLQMILDLGYSVNLKRSCTKPQPD